MVMAINRRVKNATPLVYDSIKFRSKLEVYCYKRLRESNIKTEYESKKFILQQGFELDNEKIRPITYTPDFIGDTFIIECKGMQTDSFKIKWKMFKYWLFTNKINYKLYMPRNQKDIEKVIQDINEIKI